jgi:hypothetical protein
VSSVAPVKNYKEGWLAFVSNLMTLFRKIFIHGWNLYDQILSSVRDALAA